MENEQSAVLTNWKKNYAFFLSGQFLSGITSMVVQYAIIWYLTRATGSATILSFATLLGMIPMVLLSPFVGPLVDRWDKKILLIVTDIIVAIFALVLAIVGTVSESFPIWLVFVSLFMRSVAQTFQMPTIQSILPTIVPASQITRTNGQLGMVQSANFIIAPALGAALFSVVPVNYLILLDVLGAVFGVGLLVFVKIPRVAPETLDVPLAVFKDAKLGLQKLLENKGLWYITINGAFVTLLFMPAASLYPLMTLDYFGGSVGQAGVVEVVYAVGMLLGGALISFVGTWKDRMKPIFIAYIVIGLTIGASGLVPSDSQGFLYFIILNAGAGFATPYFNTLLMAMIQQSYEPSVLGRVLGVFNSLMSLTGPIGLLFAGPLADRFGVEKMFLFAGIGILLCGIALFMSPTARDYDKKLQKELEKN
ncbi:MULTISPECIES: MFS transporter [unclassified Enterococcus]|jgi:DHA3 family macrolide efflux protein-like MFS transporter|uniref:MFS transporter n=1 Tax=unclassified Enterococcus TaxID=2608891 RepID=UPI003D27BA1F